jgi:hypothetical protein
MNGKIVGIFVIVASLIFGAVVYYTQVYYYYDTVEATGVDDVTLTSLEGDAVSIPYADFQAIDASSSPIRYRACFTTTLTLEELAAGFEPYANPDPRNAPGWFECFDAEAIGDALEAGQAASYTVQRNIEFGIDRVAAITADGRGYVWETVNDCGDKAYDGTPLGEDCPER